MSAEALRKSRHLVEWLAAQLGGKRIRGDLRSRCAAICFGVGQEHHAAIVTLLSLKQPLFASALALGRPLLEAYVRGMWLSYRATDAQIQLYLEGKIPDMASLITGIEKLHDDGDISNLRKIYDRYWKTMSGFTHTGAEHSHNWSEGEVLEPSYTSDDAGRILDFAARLGVLNMAGLAQLSTDPDLWKRVLEEARPLMPQRYESAEQEGA